MFAVCPFVVPLLVGCTQSQPLLQVPEVFDHDPPVPPPLQPVVVVCPLYPALMVGLMGLQPLLHALFDSTHDGDPPPPPLQPTVTTAPIVSTVPVGVSG